jgi:adenylate kinase
LDPGPFQRRDDDTEEAKRRHLDVYRREADALKKHYEDRGALSVVDARGSIEEVTEEILETLGHPETPAFYAASKGVG